MRSTTPTKILTRTSQCLAAAALMAGVAFGATPIVSADRDGWEVQVYLKCLGKPPHSRSDVEICCAMSDGTVSYPGGHVRCGAPAPLQAPTEPSGKPPGAPPPTEGEQGPGVPITPVPVGPGPGQG